jgi:DNA polymerase-1
LNTEIPSRRHFIEPDAFTPLGDCSEALSALSAHAATVFALYGPLSSRIEDLGMNDLYYHVELPLCRVLAEMELHGFRVDRNALFSFGDMLSRQIEEKQNEIYTLAGGEFNINSTKQLGALLFEALGLPPAKKTKTGYSRDVEVLEQLRGQHPIIDSIMTYRQAYQA